jgi:hypothetical protein
LLGWTAHQFSRRTYRITVLVAALAGVAALTEYGAASSQADRNLLVNGIRSGAGNAAATAAGAPIRWPDIGATESPDQDHLA